jgi:hypothetical protein
LSKPFTHLLSALLWFLPTFQRSKAPYDPSKLDVWHVGSMVFQLLAGRPAFASREQSENYQQYAVPPRIHIYIQCSEIYTLRYEKLHTET